MSMQLNMKLSMYCFQFERETRKRENVIRNDSITSMSDESQSDASRGAQEHINKQTHVHEDCMKTRQSRNNPDFKLLSENCYEMQSIAKLNNIELNQTNLDENSKLLSETGNFCDSNRLRKTTSVKSKENVQKSMLKRTLTSPEDDNVISC